VQWWAALTKGNRSDEGLQNASGSGLGSISSHSGGNSSASGSLGLVGFDASSRFNRTSVSVALRLIIFLTSPDGVVRKKVIFTAEK